MTSYAFLPGQGPGLTGLQPPPLDPRQQIQQIMGQGPSPSGQAPLAYSNDQIKTMTDHLQRTGSFDGMPTFDNQPADDVPTQPQQLTRPPPGQSIFGGSMPRIRPTPPPKAEGLGVSNFVGASSNDMQRMLNRGSISGDNMGDAQRRMEQLRSNEFLAKMRAQNPERFNNPPPSAPPTDPRIFPTPPPGVNPGLADGVPRQFPGFTPPPSSVAGAAGGLGGIMGQAPPDLTQYLEMMRSPMQQGGYGGPPAQAPQVNPMQSYGMMGMANPMQAQMSQMPEQIMQQGGYAPMQAPTGSQNSAPIASPFA